MATERLVFVVVKRATLLVLILIAVACDRELPTGLTGRTCAGLPFGGSASITGQVLYRGAPVPGAEIMIGGSAATSGADGRFILPAMTGTQELVVGPAETGAAQGTVLVLSGTNELRIVTARSYPDGSASGRTIDGCSGKPISGVMLEIGSRARAVSDANGHFELPDLCCNTLPDLVATKPGYDTAHQSGLGRLYGSALYFDVVLMPSQDG